MKIKQILLGTLSILALSQLAGCYTLTVPLYVNLCAPRADHEVLKLEKQETYLIERYEKRIKDIKASIIRRKRKIARSLKKKDVANATEQIDHLYRYTHPCGTRKCKVGAGSTSYGRDHIIIEEEYDRERKFINKSTDQLYNISKSLLKSGKFKVLEKGFKNIGKQFKYDSKRQNKFIKFHANIRGAWIKQLVTQADKQQKSHPGIAYLKYNKASAVAKERGNIELSKKITRKASQTKRHIEQFYSYNIYFHRPSGAASHSINGVRKAEFMGRPIYFRNRNSNAIKLVIKTQSSRPTFRVYSTNEIGTFQYSNGVTQVRNEEHYRIKSALSSAKYSYKNCSSDCEDKKMKIDTLNAELSSQGAQKTVTNYNNWEYKYILHFQESSMRMSYQFNFTDGRRNVQNSYNYKEEIGNAEHGAFSHGDGGVRPARKKIAPQRDVLKLITDKFGGELMKVINKSYDTYMKNILNAGSLRGESNRQKRLNGMMIYGVLNGKIKGSKIDKLLTELSGIPKASRFTYLK